MAPHFPRPSLLRWLTHCLSPNALPPPAHLIHAAEVVRAPPQMRPQPPSGSDSGSGPGPARDRGFPVGPAGPASVGAEGYHPGLGGGLDAAQQRVLAMLLQQTPGVASDAELLQLLGLGGAPPLSHPPAPANDHKLLPSIRPPIPRKDARTRPRAADDHSVGSLGSGHGNGNGNGNGSVGGYYGSPGRAAPRRHSAGKQHKRYPPQHTMRAVPSISEPSTHVAPSPLPRPSQHSHGMIRYGMVWCGVVCMAARCRTRRRS